MPDPFVPAFSVLFLGTLLVALVSYAVQQGRRPK